MALVCGPGVPHPGDPDLVGGWPEIGRRPMMPGRRNRMELFCWALLGGLVGTVMMDIVDGIAGKLKITWGG